MPAMIAAGVFALIAYLVGNRVFADYLQLHAVPGANELAVFLAAFIFSIVGVVALGVSDYGPAGYMVLFASSLAVLAWVVVSFMLYIDVLSRIGQVAHTIAIVEDAAWKALHDHARHPLSGARAVHGAPEGASPVFATRTGHVQFVDVEKLQSLAEEHGMQVHVAARSGDLVHPSAAVAWLKPDAAKAEAAMDKALVNAVREAFLVGPERTIEQDAGYGLIVLADARIQMTAYVHPFHLRHRGQTLLAGLEVGGVVDFAGDLDGATRAPAACAAAARATSTSPAVSAQCFPASSSGARGRCHSGLGAACPRGTNCAVRRQDRTRRSASI